jgi:hypothetical protein
MHSRQALEGKIECKKCRQSRQGEEMSVFRTHIGTLHHLNLTPQLFNDGVEITLGFGVHDGFGNDCVALQ